MISSYIQATTGRFSQSGHQVFFLVRQQLIRGLMMVFCVLPVVDLPDIYRTLPFGRLSISHSSLLSVWPAKKQQFIWKTWCGSKVLKKLPSLFISNKCSKRRSYKITCYIFSFLIALTRLKNHYFIDSPVAGWTAFPTKSISLMTVHSHNIPDRPSLTWIFPWKHTSCVH